MTQAQSASAAPSSAPAAQPTQRAQQIQRVLSQLEQRFSRSGDPLGPKRTLRNLDRIIKLDPWFRDRIAYNGLAEVVEWEGRRLRDEHVTSIRLAIGNTYGVEYGAEATQAIILETARQLIYHPVCDYLQGLLWDRAPRIDQFLSTHIGAEDTPLLRAMSRAWFVSCVARAWGKGEAPVKVDTCLVLAGHREPLRAQHSVCSPRLDGFRTLQSICVQKKRTPSCVARGSGSWPSSQGCASARRKPSKRSCLRLPIGTGHRTVGMWWSLTGRWCLWLRPMKPHSYAIRVELAGSGL